MQDKIDLEPKVIVELEQGKVITAIKILRASRAIGLKEAKEIVDSYLAQNPDIKANRGNSSSATIILLAIVFLAYTLYRIFFSTQ